MKSQFTFLRMNKICKAKKKITTAILILAMAVTSIAVSDSGAQAELQSYPRPAHNYDVYINYGCDNFNVRDTNGNILFEMVNGTVTQQDMGRAEYIYMSSYDRVEYLEGGVPPIGATISPITDLYIRGCKYFIITCTCENSVTTHSRENCVFEIYTSSGAHASYGSVPNMEISVFGDEISAERPTTKLSWEKVETAERYALHVLRYSALEWSYGNPFLYTQKTSHTVVNRWGDQYQIRAQKKVKGGWRTIKTIEITISDDEVNVDNRPTTKLHWKKSKKAERYAVLEKRTSYSMGGIPFAYTKKTNCIVRDEEGKAYQIWAQKKVKGKWKTIKTIDITL